jgi:hypothetical protein
MLKGMRRPWWLPVAVLVLATVAGVTMQAHPPGAIARDDVTREFGGARFRLDRRQADAAGASVLPDEVRRATFHFDPTVAPADRQAVLAGVASTRPEARRLIDLVDGLVHVSVGATPEHVAGITTTSGNGYLMTLNLAQVSQESGQRGIDRLVVHELGHVIDHALLPDDLIATLDAGIPQGWGCEEGVTGGCTSRSERFAESFAKWATGDIGVDLGLGYKIPPPGPTLDAWGAPLAALTASTR